MSTKNKTLKIALIFCSVLIITACNLPITVNRDKDTSSNQADDPGPVLNFGGGDTSTDQTEAAPEADEANPNPVGLQDGLGSLDSYFITLEMSFSDSKGTRTEVNQSVERSIVDDVSHSITSYIYFDPDEDEEESNETSEVFTTGTETCTYSDEEWTYETMTEQEQEFKDIFTGMVDFVPLIDNPLFVGEETMNGIPSNHFTFQVSGIGDTSGSVATVNNGEYWLAVDGQYIVKYQLDLEVHSAAEGTEGAEVTYLNALVNLTNVNQPVSITLPADCHP